MSVVLLILGASLGFNIVFAMLLSWSFKSESYGMWNKKAFVIFYLFVKLFLKKSTRYQVGFMDLDGLKAANNKYGYEGVNELVRNALSKKEPLFAVRHFGGLKSLKRLFNGKGLFDVVFQYFGGDEFVFLANSEDIFGMAKRIQKSLHEQGLSATIVLADIDQLEQAKGFLLELKDFGQRNSINNLSKQTQIREAQTL